MLPDVNSHRSYIEQSKISFLIQQNYKSQDFYVGYKNHQIVIQETTETLAIACGLKNADQVYGLTDYDIPSPSASLALDYINQDKKVLEGNKLTILDLIPCCNENILVITTRIPVVNNKFNIIGSAFFANKMNNPLLNSLSHLIMGNENKIGISLTLNEENILTENVRDEKLSNKEFEILWLLSHGLGAKGIADFLCRSPRTIEDHINNIKIKYGCTHKAELIEKAISNDILGYLPIRLAKDTRTLSIF